MRDRLSFESHQGFYGAGEGLIRSGAAKINLLRIAGPRWMPGMFAGSGVVMNPKAMFLLKVIAGAAYAI